jgi:hypothetical protein
MAEILAALTTASLRPSSLWRHNPRCKNNPLRRSKMGGWVSILPVVACSILERAELVVMAVRDESVYDMGINAEKFLIIEPRLRRISEIHENVTLLRAIL